MSRVLRTILLSTSIALAVYLFVFYSETRSFPYISEQWVGLIYAIVLINMLGFGMLFLNSVFNRIFPWSNSLSLRLLIEVLFGVIFTAIAAAIFIFTYISHFHIVDDGTFLDFIYDGTVKFGILSIVIIYIYSLLNFSLYSFKQYTIGQVEALASDRMQLDLRFEALKSQLNPHFLFNALNTISSLIYLDVKEADKYIRQLAKTYDYILKTDETRLVKCKGELDMLKAYFFMHKIRYDDCVHLNIDDAVHNIEGYIPPFTLQILVENALKHSRISEKDPLNIEIFTNENNQLVIRNNIVVKLEEESSINKLFNKEKASESYKIGLSNIRKRYMFLTNKNIDISSDTHFTIKIPIIPIDYAK